MPKATSQPTPANRSEDLIVLQHPLVLDKLTRLREKTTPHYQFKTLLEDLSICLFYEASNSLATAAVDTETPLEMMETAVLKDEILLVPILRAGLGMSNGITRIFPEARIGMLGMYRDHATLEPVDYYLRLPDDLSNYNLFLLDPMLATGGSAVAAVERLKARNAGQITFLAIISAPEGVERLHAAHPDVRVITAALDRQLNDIGYILPGLGDAGDRYFGM